MKVTYSSYLKLDKILDAQKPLSRDEHDEMLFIVIHQTYELWFKQLLHEGAFLKEAFLKGEEFKISATLRRMLVILKTAVGQVDILETITPLSFSAFRVRLEQASGFQSAQFACFEFFLGLKKKEKLDLYHENPPAHAALTAYFKAPSIFDVFLRYLHLHHSDLTIPDDVLNRNYDVSYRGDERIELLLETVYRTKPALSSLCERLVDLDEGVQEWRYKHVKMVERTIGGKMGTGGSSGAEYLKRALFYPAFPDLWNLRHRL